jgi:ADP-heptose:LPS heptosyltransferase
MRIWSLAYEDPARMAAELLAQSRSGGTFDHKLLEQLARTDSPLIFRDLVEPLCDAFDARLCDVYAELFQRVTSIVVPEARPRRARTSTRFDGEAREVYVLSRVTLGADVAVTSVVLDAVKKRFPEAAIFFVGPRKNYELFDSDHRVAHVAAPYARTGSLRDRLKASLELGGLIPRDALVVDPDSRMAQLGLIPVCPDERYLFFESRSFGGESKETISRLTQRWAGEVFGVEAAAYVAPSAEPACLSSGLVSMSLGVGENPAKRIGDEFEIELVRGLVKRGLPILLDHGAGGEESERVERAIAASGARPGQIRTWSGAFAPFAAAIARSRLYVGYDSSGQHVAAACGVPLVTVFAGYPNDRFRDRWRPEGPGPVHVVSGESPLDKTLTAIDTFLE